jgi:hypothetical protein
LPRSSPTAWSKVDNSKQFPLVHEGTSDSALEGTQDSLNDPGFFTTISSNGTQGNSAIVWAVSRPSEGGGVNPGGLKTQSDVFVAADGLMYFHGTDDKVWRVSTDGKTVRDNVGGFQTQSNIFVTADGYLPKLFSGLAGTWPNVRGNANIVPVVANGEVFVASFKQLAIFGLAPRGTMIRMTTAARPLQAPAATPLTEVSGSRFFGTITSIDGNNVVIRLRTGETLTIDLTNARKAFQTVIPFIGEPVAVSGTLEANGTLNAQTMLRAKGPAYWSPDRR